MVEMAKSLAAVQKVLKKIGTGYGFSIKSSNNRRLETQGMKIKDYVNIIDNDSINISNHSNVQKFNKFNPEVIGSLQPQGELGQDMKD